MDGDGRVLGVVQAAEVLSVIEAARLCAAAGGARILVTEIVRALAGTAGGHQFTSVGALDLKGLPAPVPACEVNWVQLPGPLLPMPALLTRAGRIFVGRNDELERLLGLLHGHALLR